MKCRLQRSMTWPKKRRRKIINRSVNLIKSQKKMKMNSAASITSKMLLMPNQDLSTSKNQIKILNQKSSETLMKFKKWTAKRREMTLKRIGIISRSKSSPTAQRKEKMQILIVRVSQWSKDEATMVLNSKTSRERGTTNNETINKSDKDTNNKTDYSKTITKQSSKNTTISLKNQTNPITTIIKGDLGTTMKKGSHRCNMMVAKSSFTKGMIANNTSKIITNNTQGNGNSTVITIMRWNNLATKIKGFKIRVYPSSKILKNSFQARISHPIHSWLNKNSEFFTASNQRSMTLQFSIPTHFRISSIFSINSNNQCISNLSNIHLETTSKSTSLSTTTSSRYTMQQPKPTLRVTSEVSKVQKDTCLILCLFQSCNSNDRQLAAACLGNSRTLCCFDSDFSGLEKRCNQENVFWLGEEPPRLESTIKMWYLTSSDLNHLTNGQISPTTSPSWNTLQVTTLIVASFC